MWYSDDAEIPPTIRDAVERAIDTSKIVGLCIGISLNGQRFFLSAGRSSVDSFDSISVHTRFKLGCLIKVLGAAVVLELCARKVIDLDSPIGQYLPELAGHPKGSAISVAHLLSHTPGYMAVNTIATRDGLSSRKTFYEQLRRAAQLFEPGQVFSYQNSAAALLGDIVLRRTGVTLSETIGSTLFAENDRFASTVPWRGGDGSHALGHVWSRSEGRFVSCDRPLEVDDLMQSAMSSKACLSVCDLLPFVEGLLGRPGTDCPGPTSLSHETILKMHEQVVSIPRGSEGAAAGFVPRAYGYGLGRYARGVMGHDSTMPGEATGFRIIPSARCAVVVGLNSDRGAQRQEIFDALFDALAVPEIPEPASDLPFSLDELEGTYAGRESLTVDVCRTGCELLLAMGYETKGLVKMLGGIDPSGHFQPRKSAGVVGELRDRICYTFFPDPHSGGPCLMMGVTALKRTGRRCS